MSRAYSALQGGGIAASSAQPNDVGPQPSDWDPSYRWEDTLAKPCCITVLCHSTRRCCRDSEDASVSSSGAACASECHSGHNGGCCCACCGAEAACKLSSEVGTAVLWAPRDSALTRHGCLQ